LNKNLSEEGREIQILPIISSPLQIWYRNKIEFSFGVYKQQNVEFRQWIKEWKTEEDILKTWIKKYDIDCNQCCGFHKQWEFAKIVDVDSCWLISDRMNQVFKTIKDLCFNSWLPVFDQKTHQWFFRHLVIREWIHTKQLMVNLSVSLWNLNEEQTKLWEQLMEEFKNNEFLKDNITTFVITYNEWLSDTVKNDQSEAKVFWGDWYIHENLIFLWNKKENNDENINEDISDDTQLTFRISPFSFFQTNTLWAEKLFWNAFKMLWIFEGNILDLYCWAWSIWLSLLKQNNNKNKNNELIWIEIVEDAINDAKVNASINWLNEQSFFVASPCEKVLIKFPELEEKIKNIGVVIVDPPREWLHPNVIEWIGKLKKEYKFKLLYISCNPVTMARDVEMLIKQQWFSAREVQPVDMFPHTHHIENICVLE
jgi:23S rRNA (uracil1939-C5)-methyltransferase